MVQSDHFEIIFPLLLINLLIAVCLLVYGLLNKRGRRFDFILFSILTLCCPVIMFLFLCSTRILERVAARKEVDMNEISFSQQREEAVDVSDYATEMNYVSLQDAMRLSSITDLRRLLMNVMKYNSRMSLTSVAEAINNDDSETAHFAAAAIQDALNEFRGTAQKFINDIQKYPEDVENNLQAFAYLYDGLMLKIMTPIEQQSYVYTTNSVAENLFQHNLWFMTAAHYLQITKLLISVPDLSMAERWVRRAVEYRPHELDTFKARLRLFFAQDNHEAFLVCLQEFKASDIRADQEMLELIRLYQG